jgi:hypothetical protein
VGYYIEGPKKLTFEVASWSILAHAPWPNPKAWLLPMAALLQKSPAQEIWGTVVLRRVAAFEFSPAF